MRQWSAFIMTVMRFWECLEHISTTALEDSRSRNSLPRCFRYGGDVVLGNVGKSSSLVNNLAE